MPIMLRVVSALTLAAHWIVSGPYRRRQRERPISRHRDGTPREAGEASIAAARTSRPLIPAPLHALLPIAIFALWAVEIDRVRLRDMTDLGLISVMPASTLVLLFVLTVSFCLSLARRPLRPWIPLAHLLVLIVILYGITAFLESEPRRETSWRHAGIIDYIARNGSVDPGIDAYFNWPGFFALGTLITGAPGFASPLALASWATLAFNLLFAPPLALIFRWASDDPRVTWLGLWVFYSANWVEQDYLAPQAVGYLLWVSMLAALLTWFTRRPVPLTARLSARALLGLLDMRRMSASATDEAETATRPNPTHRRVGLMVTAVALFAAVVTGHQLTPFFAVVAATALVVFAGLELRGLPLIMIVLLAAWISYMTTTYLSGHFDVVTGSVGSTSQNISTSISGRIGGSSEHEFIVNIRVISSACIGALAIAGLARRLLARRVDVALGLIAATPLVLPILQPYGGEIVLRVFLFSLPAVAFFIACLAFPTLAAGRGRRTLAAVTAMCCALVGSFQFTRYGNERLDHFTPGDVAAVAALYRVAPPGATLLGSHNLPWRYRDYAAYKYRSITRLQSWDYPTPAPHLLAKDVEDYAAEEGGVYVIVTRSTEISAALLQGKPGALEGLVEVLRDSPSARQLYRGRDGDVFYVEGSDAAQPAPRPDRRGRPRRPPPPDWPPRSIWN